jgi:hypothetical protein
MKYGLLILLLYSLMACSPNEDPPQPPQVPTEAPELTVTQTLPIEDRLELEERYTHLRELHSKIAEVWESLDRGETAQCGEEYETLSPELFSGTDAPNVSLRRAAVMLVEAAELWEAECARPGENVAPDVIQQGMSRIREAGSALDDAGAALTG